MTEGKLIDKKIRWGLVGCGRISQNHLDALTEYSTHVDLIAVCDIQRDRAMSTAHKYACMAFTDLEEMLSKSNLDALSICTPSGLHPSHGILASKNKTHVITEKPMATKVNEAINLINECKKNRVNLYVVKQNRLNPTIQNVYKAIKAGRFGDIHYIQVNVFWTRPQEYYDQSPWRGTRDLDGGALMNQASHYVDLITWLIGQPKYISALLSTQKRRIEMEDSAAIALKWPNGALGSINVTMLTYPKNLEGSITILGEKGTVKIGGIALNKVEAWEFAELDAQDTDPSYATDSVYGFGHSIFYKNVINHLKGKTSVVFDGDEGLESLKLLERIYKDSSDLRKPKELDNELL
jgi:UDP-N-acetyl-2-amino-2-deoxyglucuronate dehydrogenase